MLSRLFIAALWSPAGKELTSWLLFVMSNCDFVTFPCGILGQVWYLIVLNPDISYFKNEGEQNNYFIIDSNLKLRPYEICFSNSSMVLPLCHHQLKI